ncbi:MAG: carbohydrate kinase family protein, partial [Chloroflexi bacterium]|nr:carbohydrate kinase family protein [Chloroflexota bacterium]
AIGQDTYGALVWQRLAQFDALDVSLLARLPDVSTPFCRVFVTGDGEHRSVAWGFDAAPHPRLPDHALDQAHWMFLGAYAGARRLALAQRARRLGKQVAAAQVLHGDDPLLPLCDLIVNRAGRSENLAAIANHTRALQSESRGLVVTTSGAGLVVAVEPGGVPREHSPLPAQVRDTLGAGDAFMAGCLYGLLQGWPESRCIAFALSAAALCVERWGGSDPPAKPEVLRLMEETWVD